MRKAEVVRVKRVYESMSRSDGTRFLVERFWPRAVKKEKLKLEAWLKDVAPSDSLRRWFGHDPAKWEEFQHRYKAELQANPGALQPLMEAAKQRIVTVRVSAGASEARVEAYARSPGVYSLLKAKHNSGKSGASTTPRGVSLLQGSGWEFDASLLQTLLCQ